MSCLVTSASRRERCSAGSPSCSVVTWLAASWGPDLMLRIGAERSERAVAEPHVRRHGFHGKPLRGFVYVGPEGVASDEMLRAWIDQAAAFTASLPPK